MDAPNPTGLKVMNKHVGGPHPGGQHVTHPAAMNFTDTISNTAAASQHTSHIVAGPAGGSTLSPQHHHHHHHPHHTPDGAAISEPPKEYVHDGTTYASGASNEPYTDEEIERPGLATRVKEALPFTREHKEKREREGDLAVYM